MLFGTVGMSKRIQTTVECGYEISVRSNTSGGQDPYSYVFHRTVCFLKSKYYATALENRTVATNIEHSRFQLLLLLADVFSFLQPLYVAVCMCVCVSEGKRARQHTIANIAIFAAAFRGYPKHTSSAPLR